MKIARRPHRGGIPLRRKRPRLRPRRRCRRSRRRSAPRERAGAALIRLTMSWTVVTPGTNRTLSVLAVPADRGGVSHFVEGHGDAVMGRIVRRGEDLKRVVDARRLIGPIVAGTAQSAAAGHIGGRGPRRPGEHARAIIGRGRQAPPRAGRACLIACTISAAVVTSGWSRTVTLAAETPGTAGVHDAPGSSVAMCSKTRSKLPSSPGTVASTRKSFCSPTRPASSADACAPGPAAIAEIVNPSGASAPASAPLPSFGSGSASRAVKGIPLSSVHRSRPGRAHAGP